MAAPTEQTSEQTLVHPAYETGDETHRRFVASLRGLPQTMSWDEIDAARDDEQLALLVTARGLPQATTWEEIRQIESDDYQRKIRAQRALVAMGCDVADYTSAEEALKIHGAPSSIRNRQIDALENLFVESWVETEWGVVDLERVLALPDPRTPIKSPSHG